jgi:hypothetical protein
MNSIDVSIEVPPESKTGGSQLTDEEENEYHQIQGTDLFYIRPIDLLINDRIDSYPSRSMLQLTCFTSIKLSFGFVLSLVDFRFQYARV